jgi:hypothetical protein
MFRQQRSELSDSSSPHHRGGGDDDDDDHENPDASSSNSKQQDEGEGEEEEASPSSMLLLQILAAADYFTTDTALMSSVPAVDVDIILDPFLFNVLPRSLAGTACYIVAVAAVAYLVARRVASWIGELAVSGSSREESVKKRQ